MEPEEPDLSLLEPRRWGPVPVLLLAFLLIASAGALYFSPPRAPRKLPPERPRPAAPAPPLYVTLAPPAEPEAPATQASQGWCCVGRRLSAASRPACESAKGVFFAAETEARKLCPPPPTGPSGSPRGRGRGV
jgi:hypothetical protein